MLNLRVSSLLLLVSLICELAVASELDIRNESLAEWEYEPRIWSVDPEDSPEEVNSMEMPNDFMDSSSAYQLDEFERQLQQEGETISAENSDPHLRHHYFEPGDTEAFVRQSLFAGSDERRQEDHCTQFRVDIREAVVCDKKRCDKLDFEWPTYDNQLSIIETTKHGMRFHKSNLAMAPKIATGSAKPKPKPKPKVAMNEEERIKFDLFELFKPKPSSTEAPATETTTTEAEETTTKKADEEEGETTTASDEDTESTTTNADEATEGDEESTTSAGDEESTTTPEAGDSETTTGSGEASESSTVAGSLPTRNEALQNTTRLITTFRLDTRRTRQKMMGFGGALSDSTCRNIKSLSPQMTKSLMEDYYGDRGLRYTFVRMSVGSSDFSTTPYTNNDRNDTLLGARLLAIDPRDDVEMKNFHLTDEDYEFKLPVARQAIATSSRELKFFSSLWSPPIWMKDNNHIVHGNLKGDIYGPYYRALAEMMVKWLEAYRKSGIEFWGLTSLNEPVTGVKPFINHNSLGISTEDYITFYKLYLGPLLRQRGFQKAKLMILDDNKGYVPFLVRKFLQDKEASKYVSGVAIHWYMNDDYENLNQLAKNHPDKFILATEACNGYVDYQRHVLPGDWDRGTAYMLDIIRTIQKGSVGWVDWNMVLDVAGGPSWAKNFLDAAVLVNAGRDEYYKSPMFYAMGHFSRFVEPDSLRLDHRLGNARFDYPLEATAFHTTKGYIVVVAVNANRHLVPFRIIVDKELVRIVTLKAESFTTIVFKWRSRYN